MVTVELIESRADLAECIAHHRAECLQFTRRGYIGVRDRKYADLHEAINDLLEFWEIAPT